LVGNALSLTPSPYHLQVNGQTLFAWCALDTLFLPACIGQAAQVTSTCHIAGTPITLLVTPEGVKHIDPAITVLSIAVPGVTPSCDLKAKTGPQGPVCPTMHFFSSKIVAIPWLEDHPGMAILSIEEAWQLAYRVWIEPSQRES
jgi:alkylmercury lyase